MSHKRLTQSMHDWRMGIWFLPASGSTGTAKCDEEEEEEDKDDPDKTPPYGIDLGNLEMPDEIEVEMKRCPDCKGMKRHLLLYSYKRCSTCRGTGEVEV